MIAVNYVVFVAVVAGSGFLVLLTLASRLSVWFLSACGLLLAGYAFFGKGFAYIRVPPAFVGEFVLGIGLLAFFVALPRIRFGPIHSLLIAFMTSGTSAYIAFCS